MIGRLGVRGGASRALRGAAALLVGLMAAVGLVGCTSARDTLGTSNSTCFEAIAIAGSAVHHRGSFAGVRLVTFDEFEADVKLRDELVDLFGTAIHDVCVVSYRGTFASGQVAQPLGSAPAGGIGHYAIVIVSKPQNRLLGTVIRSSQPLRFGHPV